MNSMFPHRIAPGFLTESFGNPLIIREYVVPGQLIHFHDGFSLWMSRHSRTLIINKKIEMTILVFVDNMEIPRANKYVLLLPKSIVSKAYKLLDRADDWYLMGPDIWEAAKTAWRIQTGRYKRRQY